MAQSESAVVATEFFVRYFLQPIDCFAWMVCRRFLDINTVMTNIFIVIVLILVLACLYARFIEPNLVIIRRVKLHSNRAVPRKTPLRITLISDFHYPRYSNQRLIRQAIEISNRFDPDLVFLLGDFFDKNRKDSAILPDNAHLVFSGISSKLGIFGVLGNHDHWFDAKAIRNLLDTKTSIRLIDNSSVCLCLKNDPLYIVGVGDLWAGDTNYTQAVRDIPLEASILLLSHNPDVVEEISDPRILIQFSGHTHGGQVRFPFLGALKVPSKFGNKYSKGLVANGNHLLYVNCGVCSMKHLRFMCPPEITWVEIY